MRKRDVRDHAVAKERRLSRSGAGAIEKLIRNHHVERRILLLQRTDRGSRQDALDSQKLHRVDVRAKRNFRGREPMTDAMTRQKRYPLAFDGADDEPIG